MCRPPDVSPMRAFLRESPVRHCQSARRIDRDVGIARAKRPRCRFFSAPTESCQESGAFLLAVGSRSTIQRRTLLSFFIGDGQAHRLLTRNAFRSLASIQRWGQNGMLMPEGTLDATA
jgi:hypothetical protein